MTQPNSKVTCEQNENINRGKLCFKHQTEILMLKIIVCELKISAKGFRRVSGQKKLSVNLEMSHLK